MRSRVLDRRKRLVTPLTACLLVGFGATVVVAADKDLDRQRRALVKENCARCHAIGKEGASPHPEAPPFRTLSSKYPVEDLAESLAEGIVSGHPDMPIFVFTRPTCGDHRLSTSIQDAPAQPAEDPESLLREGR